MIHEANLWSAVVKWYRTEVRLTCIICSQTNISQFLTCEDLTKFLEILWNNIQELIANQNLFKSQKESLAWIESLWFCLTLVFPVEQLNAKLRALDKENNENSTASQRVLSESNTLMLVSLLNSLETSRPRINPSTHAARLWSLAIEHLATADPKVLSDGKIVQWLAQTVLDWSVRLQEIEWLSKAQF